MLGLNETPPEENTMLLWMLETLKLYHNRTPRAVLVRKETTWLWITLQYSLDAAAVGGHP